mmetsp:Transcript_27303/g.58471  ORF Transcript_27303/g.58471 Transcript_27303/m.58471 type:complete len:97 (-) Transcript_27303:976-1266(-)
MKTLPHLQQHYRTDNDAIPMTTMVPHRRCYPTDEAATPPTTMLPHRQQHYPTDDDTVSLTYLAPCFSSCGKGAPSPTSLNSSPPIWGMVGAKRDRV